MLPDETPAQAHARAIRAAHRQDTFDRLIAATGARIPNEPVTQPIPVVVSTEASGSWLSAG
jgi:hypothetical protein